MQGSSICKKIETFGVKTTDLLGGALMKAYNLQTAPLRGTTSEAR